MTCISVATEHRDVCPFMRILLLVDWLYYNGLHMKQWTEDKNEQTMLAFKRKFKINMISIVLSGAAYITLMLNFDASGPGAVALKILCAIVAGGAIVSHFLIWRCPACDHYLFEQIYPKSCSKCGAKFRK